MAHKESDLLPEFFYHLLTLERLVKALVSLHILKKLLALFRHLKEAVIEQFHELHVFLLAQRDGKGGSLNRY